MSSTPAAHKTYFDAGTPEALKLHTDSDALSTYVRDILDENSAQDILEIDIRGKSSIADYMVVASGRSNRHVGALADYVIRGMKQAGFKDIGTEGQEGQDWVLIDGGDVILHIFRPEVRVFYNLEKIWSVPLPDGLREMSEQAPADPSE
ncbi:ribosome silencing factor [Algimonas ampicilliniresistens]